MKFGLWTVLGILTGVIIILFLKEAFKKRGPDLFGLNKISYDEAVKNKLVEIDNKKKRK